MSDAITIHDNIDWTGMLQGINEQSGAVFEQWGAIVVEAIQEIWTGWVEETGTSQAAWYYELEGNSLIVRNDAGYAGYVHRAGTPPDDLEAVVVWNFLVEDQGQELLDALTEAIATVLGAEP